MSSLDSAAVCHEIFVVAFVALGDLNAREMWGEFGSEFPARVPLC